MKASLLVPYRATPDRDPIWRWLQQRWTHDWPDLEQVVGFDDGIPFSKAAAVNAAAAAATGELFVIADADVWYHPSALQEGLTIAAAGGWAIPGPVRRLDEPTTRALILRPPTDPFPNLPWRGHHLTVGGLLILPRPAFFQVGGMDPVFRGWGGEDVAFGKALDTLWAPRTILRSALWHLWHPELRTAAGRRIWPGQTSLNDHLTRPYVRAGGDPQSMRRVIERDE